MNVLEYHLCRLVYICTYAGEIQSMSEHDVYCLYSGRYLRSEGWGRDKSVV